MIVAFALACLLAAPPCLRPHPRAAAGAPAESPPGAHDGVGRYALLVGVTDYPNLPKRRWLKGPANDIELVRQLLREKFDFPDINIVTLKEGTNPSQLPTRENILRELAALAGRARRGDRVVVFFSGHGSLQPHVRRPGDTNPDAFDGLFLPRDVSGWDRAVQAVANAIVDRELSDWIKGLRDRDVSLWLVVDAC